MCWWRTSGLSRRLSSSGWLGLGVFLLFLRKLFQPLLDNLQERERGESIRPDEQ